jgi:large subunit ribosomal protein L6
MSRLGKLPVQLIDGVTAELTETSLNIKGNLGALVLNLHPSVAITIEDNQILCAPNAQHPMAKTMVGTMRALANNMVKGVSAGWEKSLQLIGVGYRALIQGDKLVLTLGYSNPRELKIPEGITVTSAKATEVTLKGCDKQQVGAFAATIRMQRPPEPYKGKGVRYLGEYIAKKEGKKK